MARLLPEMLFDDGYLEPTWLVVNTNVTTMTANGTVSLPTGTEVGDLVCVMTATYTGVTNDKADVPVAGYTAGLPDTLILYSYRIKSSFYYQYPISNTSNISISGVGNTVVVIYSFRPKGTMPTFLDPLVTASPEYATYTINQGLSALTSVTAPISTDYPVLFRFNVTVGNNYTVSANGYDAFTSYIAANTGWPSVAAGIISTPYKFNANSTFGVGPQFTYSNTAAVGNTICSIAELRTRLFEAALPVATSYTPFPNQRDYFGNIQLTTANVTLTPLEASNISITPTATANLQVSVNGGAFTNAIQYSSGGANIRFRGTTNTSTLGVNSTSVGSASLKGLFANGGRQSVANDSTWSCNFLTQRQTTATTADVTIVIPAGLSQINVACTGAGGLGGTGNTTTKGSGGGGGAMVWGNITVATAQTVVFSPGQGSSSNSYVSVNGANVIVAVGGANGISNGAGGAGGSAASSTGPNKNSGGAGGSSNNSIAGGGGGAGGWTGAGGAGGSLGGAGSDGAGGAAGGGAGGTAATAGGGGGGGTGLTAPGANGAGATTAPGAGGEGSPDTIAAPGSVGGSVGGGGGGTSGGGGGGGRTGGGGVGGGGRVRAIW